MGVCMEEPRPKSCKQPQDIGVLGRRDGRRDRGLSESSAPALLPKRAGRKDGCAAVRRPRWIGSRHVPGLRSSSSRCGKRYVGVCPPCRESRQGGALPPCRESREDGRAARRRAARRLFSAPLSCERRSSWLPTFVVALPHEQKKKKKCPRGTASPRGHMPPRTPRPAGATCNACTTPPARKQGATPPFLPL